MPTIVFLDELYVREHILTREHIIFVFLDELHEHMLPPYRHRYCTYIYIYIYATTPPPIRDCDAEGGALV